MQLILTNIIFRTRWVTSWQAKFERRFFQPLGTPAHNRIMVTMLACQSPRVAVVAVIEKGAEMASGFLSPPSYAHFLNGGGEITSRMTPKFLRLHPSPAFRSFASRSCQHGMETHSEELLRVYCLGNS